MNKIVPTQPPAAPVAELLDKQAVCKRLNMSPRALEYMVRDGAFPPAVRIGRRMYWSEVAVRAWQQRLFAAQEAWQPLKSAQFNIYRQKTLRVGVSLRDKTFPTPAIIYHERVPAEPKYYYSSQL